MATIITSFDPTQTATGNFSCGLVNGGWLFIHNESPLTMLFDLGTARGTVLVSSDAVRCVKVGIGTDRITYQRVSQLVQPTNALLSRVYAEAYQESEWTGGEGYWPLSGPLYQERVIALPMLNISKQPNRVTMPTDTQASPVAAQVLANPVFVGTAGTNGFASVFSVEVQPVTVGECTVALGFTLLDAGGAITTFITPFGYYDISRAGQFGPTQGVYESFVTPRYVTMPSYGASDSKLAVYYYLFDGYGGMAVDISVNWSLMNASAVGLTNILPPAAYGQFPSNNQATF
jgi:hypothetical protein